MAQKLVNLGQRIATATPRLVTKVSFLALDVAKKAQPPVVTFLKNAKVEMLPPKPSDWRAIQKSFLGLKDSAMKGKFLDLTVKEAAANTLVAVEIAFWFYVGEVIGRKSLIGYNV
ncbi:ATP synthase subunit g, mitochondrial-like [Stylophora pistillata]|uniref:ATP synthase subunit g, mitochondrial n=1 Tax=Stylophora pistillata TaxID=50429 RepID=A0A2B4S5Z1_STYPI|nr:ATP synthase subunit g, mitochondrial-like [Stylophora pistillata]PFX24453.1 ATP synthase subunit g, mitochondrial [Stylophora pistillata]